MQNQKFLTVFSPAQNDNKVGSSPAQAELGWATRLFFWFWFWVCGFAGLGAEEREEDDVADGAGAGEDHGEAVDADAFASSGGQAVAEGADVVLVHLVGFVVASFSLG